MILATRFGFASSKACLDVQACHVHRRSYHLSVSHHKIPFFLSFQVFLQQVRHHYFQVLAAHPFHSTNVQILPLFSSFSFSTRKRIHDTTRNTSTPRHPAIGSRTRLRDQCFLFAFLRIVAGLRDQCLFCLSTHCCRASLLARLWFDCSQRQFLKQR